MRRRFFASGYIHVLSLQGNYSSKVMAIVRCIKKIEQQDPTAKALIFSTWSSLLDIVAEALQENSIVYRQLSGHNSSKYENDLFR